MDDVLVDGIDVKEMINRREMGGFVIEDRELGRQ